MFEVTRYVCSHIVSCGSANIHAVTCNAILQGCIHCSQSHVTSLRKMHICLIRESIGLYIGYFDELTSCFFM